MTNLLEQAFEKVQALPLDMQNAIARMLLAYAGEKQTTVPLIPQSDSRQARAVDLNEIDAITRRSASRPLLDRRSSREILADAWGEPA